MFKSGLLGLVLGVATIMFALVIIKAILPNSNLATENGSMSTTGTISVLVAYIVITILFGYIIDLIFKGKKK